MEKKRQKRWEENKVYKVTEDPNKEKFYILDMFPYPSGSGLHVGHPKGYVASDTLARKKMLEGFSVLHPMGFDTFGLGTEQYAIDHKMKPQDVADQNISYYKEQLEKIWFSYDWERSFSTAEPEYYKWTQWIFLQFYTHYYDEEKKQACPIEELRKKLEIEWLSGKELEEALDKERLAFIDYKPINRCPHCKTGLANEDLEDGRCERCASEVEQRPMRQWVLRITKYADRLLEGLDELDWDESMKELERNWIGKSEGTQFKMQLKDSSDFFEVFTTRIDTVFGMTFVVMAPEHKLVDQITTPEYKAAVEKYKEQAKHKTQLERTELQKEKTGQFTGAYAINPFNGDEIPVFIGDYVLANYGTGVVMAVPAHDERDYEFAKEYNIPIKQSIMPTLYEKNGAGTFRPDKPLTKRTVVSAYLKHWSEDKVLVLDWQDFGWKTFVMGGLEEWETPEEAIKREIREETGYVNIKSVKKAPTDVQTFFYAAHKDVCRKAHEIFFIVELADGEQLKTKEEDTKNHRYERIESHKVEGLINTMWHTALLDYYLHPRANTEKGSLIDSGEFSGLSSDEAIKKMQERLKTGWLGGVKANYKIQDWVFSRQRYWWEPFPIVFCTHCGEQDLQGHIHSINFYNQVAWNWIKKKHKTIETRALNPEEPERYFWNIPVGDILKMINKETGEVMYGKITEKYQWNSFEELFNEPELEKTYSDPEEFKRVKTIEDIKAGRNFLEGYVEKIENHGLVGWKIELVDIAKTIPMKESDLPLTLPDVDNYEPTGREEGPLADISRWMHADCPVCGNKAKRESNTMPGRAGSSRYWLRYMDPKNTDALVDKEIEQYRGNVDVYVGGAEHVTRHMIYARFWQKFLYDLGVVSKQEPFQKYEKVWLIMAEDGRKMSKRWGNVVNPDDVIAEHGADAFRAYEMFMGPFDQFVNWNTNGLKGVRKFLDKVISLYDKLDSNAEVSKEVETLLHQTIKKTTEDIDQFRFNTSIAQFMILANKLSELEKVPTQVFETFIILLAPFAPHLAEEFWEKLGHEFSIFTKGKWPTYDEKKLTADTIQLAIQFNGKVRGTLHTSPSANESEIMELIKWEQKLNEYLNSGEVKKVIYVPGKIMNIVVA